MSRHPRRPRRRRVRGARLTLTLCTAAVSATTLGVSLLGSFGGVSEPQSSDAAVAGYSLPDGRVAGHASPTSTTVPDASVVPGGGATPSASPTSTAPASTPPASSAALSASPAKASAGAPLDKAPTSASTQKSSASAPAAKPPAPAPVAPAPGATRPNPSLGAGSWLSGASGDGSVTGTFGAWRGRDVDIVGTWADNNEAQTALWMLHPGESLGSWDKSLDIAIGAIGDGESWEQAASGAYDGRWRESLTKMHDLWGSRPGTLYIRFAHEMNGNWYPWKVTADDADAFVTSWKRFRELQQEIFPASKLVFCVNRESVGTGVDWRETFPGSQYVDVMGVDYYNQYPYVGSAEDWEKSLTATTEGGAPKGLQAHLDFARSVGLPLVVPEWSGNSHNGDSTAFMQGMHDFFAANAGSGPGQLMYEIVFNIDKDEKAWLLYPGTEMPQSADAYKQLW